MNGEYPGYSEGSVCGVAADVSGRLLPENELIIRIERAGEMKGTSREVSAFPLLNGHIYGGWSIGDNKDFNSMRDCGDYTISDWTFRINGKEFFVKGCNWMPADSFHDENPAILEWQLSLVRDARIQMLRVWGAGGIRIRLLP